MPHSPSFTSFPELTRRATQIERFDDTSVRIVYSGTWRRLGDPLEFKGGSLATWNNDARASFMFTGTGVKVFGTVRKTNSASGVVTSSYSLDGAEPSIYRAPTNPTMQPLYFQEFFSTLSLPNQEYTLTIAFIDGSALYLDYLEVYTVTNSTKPSGTDLSRSPSVSTGFRTSSLETNSVLPNDQTGTVTSGSSPASDPTNSSNTAHSAVKRGTIAGVVCGTIAFLGLVTFLFIRRRRQSRRQRTSELRYFQHCSTVSAPWHAGLGTSGTVRKADRLRFPSTYQVDGRVKGVRM